MLAFLALLAIVASTQAASCPGITCRCYDGQPKYPTYPSILSCKIPNSDEWVVTFCEEDATWNPQHEFPAGPGSGPFQYGIVGGAPDANGAMECAGGTPCQTLTSVADASVKSGYFKCSLISPKCWFDPGRVENTVWTGQYGCADNDLPKPAKSGATCPMKCMDGFKMVGKPPVCSGGKWIKFPQCKPAGCGAPPADPAGKWKLDASSVCKTKPAPYPKKTTCSVTCPAGFDTNEDLECDIKNGKPTWDIPKCIKQAPNNCKGPFKPFPKNGHFNCKKVAHGGVCPLHCEDGFEPAGTLPKCNNGAWVEPGGVSQKAHCKCKPFQHIDTNTPLACVFGGFSGIDRLDFVVDVSGSMKATMKVGGSSISRIAYLKKALAAAIDALDDSQYFNIVKYSTGASQWKNGVVKATDANRASGKSYAGKLSANGGTNMYQGLQLASKDPTVSGIFILTDGQPTLYGSPAKKESRSNPYKRIQDMVGSWKGKGGNMAKIKLFPISFMAPKKFWPKLQWLADTTGGKFHKII